MAAINLSSMSIACMPGKVIRDALITNMVANATKWIGSIRILSH